MKKRDYQARMAAEIKHYQQIFKSGLFQEVPPVWDEVERKFADKIERATGVRGLPEYIARRVKGRKKIRMISLGSGACGVELELVAPLLKAQGTKLELSSVDINQKILERAEGEAQKRKVDFKGIVQDINKLRLEPNRYDVIMVFAALHHFEKLNHITRQINRGLKRAGCFVTVDIPTRNGYLLWDETKSLIEKLWRVLPARYKWDHTVSKVPVYMPKFPDKDYSVNSFECANSEAILPALKKNLRELEFVPAMTIARRFFDTKFGPNFDLRKKRDRDWFELIMDLDERLLAGKILKPETFFGVYAKKVK